MLLVGSMKRAGFAAGVVLSVMGGAAAFAAPAQPARDRSSLEARVLFAKEGTWSGGIGTAKGPPAILKMLRKAFAKSKPYDPQHVRSFHLMTNFHIRVDGDRATATSKWTFFQRSADDKLVPRLSGHYDDVFIREDGQWKFLSRVAPRDIP